MSILALIQVIVVLIKHWHIWIKHSKMLIKKDMKIVEIQSAFHHQFPGLKIEFYKKEHEDHMGSALSDQHAPELSLEEINYNGKEGEIDFNASKTVGEVESEMEERFDLHVQIFRKSKDIWLQTSKTDDWTLEVQNRKGIHSEQIIKS
jgi:hypothetical protein